MFGSLFVGVIADHWGRRTSLVLSAVPYFTGYIMISYGHYLPTAISFKCILLVGRFLTGIGVGFSYSLCPVGVVAIKCVLFLSLLCLCVCLSTYIYFFLFFHNYIGLKFS